MDGNKIQKKKPQIIKKYSLCFPNIYQYKIITDITTSEYILKSTLLIHTFNSLTKKTIKFGFNSTMSILQNKAKQSTPKLLFIFYKDSLRLMLNMILMKALSEENNKSCKLFLIDEVLFKKQFIDKLKIKKLLCYTIIESDKNSMIFNDLVSKLSQHDNILINKLNPIYKQDIKEITIEK